MQIFILRLLLKIDWAEKQKQKEIVANLLMKHNEIVGKL